MGRLRFENLFRLLAVVCFISLVLSSLAVAPRHQTAAQEQGALIGDAPTGDAITVAEITTAAEPILTTSASVDISSREASAAFYLSWFETETPAIGWTGSFSTCTPGTTSLAFQEAVLRRIAYYRAMAGVPASIGLSGEGNELAQHAALMMGKAGTLSHDPAPDWPCYTERGEAGAGSSNLALGSYGPSAIAGYMRDPGPNNAAVGHRRWILYPRTELFGTGDVPGGSGAYGANALRVFGEPYGDPQPATRDGFVAWPPPGYVPYQVTYPRWSFSYPGADFSGASVTVSTAGQPVALAIESAVSPSYGNNTIVWRMDNLGDWAYWPAPSSDKPYQVTVSNVVINGSAQTFTYEVIVIDPADDGRPDPSVTLNTDRTTVNNWVTFSIIGYPPNSPVQITWRRLSGSRINIDTVQTDGTGAAAGRFRVPATPGGPNQQIAFTSGSSSQTLLFEVAPRIKVLTNPAVRGDEVNISLRGYAKQEAVRIRWRNPADGKWVELARITTSNTGSANVLVTAPAWAPDGNNSVRGDGTVFRQQTNTVAVSGGPFQPASEASPTPSPTATPTGTPTVTETPVETATSTPELTETPAVTETPVETETPAETETATPTETPVETVTAEPTETATDEPTAAP